MQYNMEQEYINSNPYYFPMDIPQEQLIEFQKWHQYQLMMYQTYLYNYAYQPQQPQQPQQPYITTGMFPANGYIQEEVGEKIMAEAKAEVEAETREGEKEAKAEESETKEEEKEAKVEAREEDYPLIKPIYIDASQVENSKNIHEPGIIINIGSDYFKSNYKIVRRMLDEQITHLTGSLGQLVPGAQLFYWYFPKELKLLDILVIRDTKNKDYMEEYAFRIIGKQPINKKLPELSMYGDYCAICKWF